MLYYLILIIFGIINAFLSEFLYVLIGSLLFSGQGALVLLIGPIYIFSTSIPFLYFLFLLVEIPIAVLVSTLLLRRLNRSEQRYIVSFLIAVVLFIILQIAALVIPPLFKQAATERKNPIESGAKQYDFSQATLFDSRQSAKNTLSIEGNKIVWIEHTKEYPTYPNNIWNVFLFEFDSATSQGVSTQVSNLDNAKHGSPESAGVFDGKVYWTQDADLYVYDSPSKKSELLVKGVGHIYGKYKNFLIYSHGSNPSIYGIKESGLFVYDQSSKQETDLSSQIANAFGIISKDEYLCYASAKNPSFGKNLIGRYNILTKQNDSVKTELENIQLTYGFQVLDCNGKYIAYKFGAQTTPGTPSPTELRIYSFDQDKNILVKRFDNRIGSVQGKFVGDAFYYSSDDNKILKRDLIGGVESVILSESGLADWDIDNSYVVYQKETGGYKSNLYLQKIQP